MYFGPCDMDNDAKYNVKKPLERYAQQESNAKNRLKIDAFSKKIWSDLFQKHRN